MISNFIFHFVFAVFTIWAATAWFISQNRQKSIRCALVPLLCLEKIEFPKHRSLFIRAIKSLEDELSSLFQIKITITCPISNNTFYFPSMFKTFCLFFSEKNFNETANIEFENKYFTLHDLRLKLMKTPKIKKINFIIQNKNDKIYFWQVEIPNA